MMRIRRSGSDGGSSRGSSSEEAAGEMGGGWEMRPGGMLVQTRNPDPVVSPPEVRFRVFFRASRFEVSICSLATFGELKKLLTVETGLQPAEQRLLYKGKERGDGEFLDVCGVKNRSKVVLAVDPTSLERRFIEMRKNVRIQNAQRAISAVSMEVDKLADQVTTIEKLITRGNKVAEVQITTLIELLMRQAVKLDSIHTEGDASSQKNLQAKRVQKCVETLDMLKITNDRLKTVIITTKWETFDPPTTTQWEYFD
ncbi:BAG family molecular chaperone regulator 1-like [Canna indica]|uniref:BAG family molecular chaperone regulator 1-like n=1 Tax=Canna indica TaxID=4628 RepID=A0AAQ3KA24_9LILI|nr:BAG family molecular chaperone regulator 1-like [Canna indica]